MDENKYPRICYNQLLAVHNNSRNNIQLNWITQFLNILSKTNGIYVLLKANKADEVFEAYNALLQQTDNNRIEQSTYSFIYKQLAPYDCNYFRYNIFKQQQIVSQ